MAQVWRSQWRVFGFLMPFYWLAWPLVIWCVASAQRLYEERLFRVTRLNATGDISNAANANTTCSQLPKGDDDDDDDGVGVGDEANCTNNPDAWNATQDK